MNRARPPLNTGWALAATWFGSGYLPFAPGTWGSLFALPVAWLILSHAGPTVLLAAAALVTALGWWATRHYQQYTGKTDPGPVVIDEVAGQWVSLLPAAAMPTDFILGFLLFRAFDIVKPWPASALERKIDGPGGVMLDDIAAGVYAALCLWGLKHAANLTEFPI